MDDKWTNMMNFDWDKWKRRWWQNVTFCSSTEATNTLYHAVSFARRG